MIYDADEKRLIIADSFQELNYNQKKLFMAANNPANANRAKYRDAVIKTLPDGVYNKLADKFFSQEYCDKLFAYYERTKIVCVTFRSPLYPEALKKIPTPPIVLYCKGNTELLKGNLFGVVGSRRTIIQATTAVKNICSELTEHFTIVTGVADGADTAAATGALQNGRAICVLPFGLKMAEQSAQLIVRDAEKGGLIISEFAGGQPALKYAFPLRNRIIAGLCRGVLVASAADKSGALSTARFASDFGRDLFAFPYTVGISSGVGCNRLIKDGAHLTESAQDVFDFYGLKSSKKNKEDLPDDERAVMQILRDLGETHADRLASMLGIKNFEVAVICSSLQIKGLIVKTGGNKYAALK